MNKELFERVLISIKPKWCAKIMNGDKTVEVRTSKALANAIQKLIDEYGYAEFYVYCSKGKKLLVCGDSPFKEGKEYGVSKDDLALNGNKLPVLNGKVIFKFRCYKVEEWDIWQEDLEEKIKLACLSIKEFDDYSKGQVGYAIHISDLEIFDKPKELSEFYKVGLYKDLNDYFTDEKQINGKWCIPLKKAPQSWCYVEVER